MSFKAIPENKTLAKISEFTVSIPTHFLSVNSFPTTVAFLFCSCPQVAYIANKMNPDQFVAVVDPEELWAVHSNPTPRPPFLNIL